MLTRDLVAHAKYYHRNLFVKLLIVEQSIDEFSGDPLVSYLREYILELVRTRKLEYSPDFCTRLWAILKAEGEGLYPEVVELPGATELIVKTAGELALRLIARSLIPDSLEHSEEEDVAPSANFSYRSIYHQLAVVKGPPEGRWSTSDFNVLTEYVDDEMAKNIAILCWTGYSENADLKRFFTATTGMKWPEAHKKRWNLNFTVSYDALVELFRECQLDRQWIDRAEEAVNVAFGLAKARKFRDRKAKQQNSEFVKQYNNIVWLRKLVAVLRRGARPPDLGRGKLTFQAFLGAADRPIKVAEVLSPLRGLIEFEPGAHASGTFQFVVGIPDEKRFLTTSGLKLRPKPKPNSAESNFRISVDSQDVKWPPGFTFAAGLLCYDSESRVVLELIGRSGTKVVMIPQGIEVIGPYSFAGSCIERPLFDSAPVIRIEAFAFSGSRITEVAFPPSLREIGQCAFAGCSLLQKVVFVDGLIKIGEHAFFNDTGLTEIRIPQTVKEILEAAFQGCLAVREIEFRGEPSELTLIEVHAFQGTLVKQRPPIKVKDRSNFVARNIGFENDERTRD